MNDEYFFDTDCLSAFLWIKEETILEHLYPGKIVLPREVYKELSIPTVSHLKTSVDRMIARKSVVIVDILEGSEAYDLFIKFTISPDKFNPVIGKGEAAALALAKVNHGTIASNNLRDISKYIQQYHLKHITTGDILIEAYYRKLINEKEGNVIWAKTLKKRRRLGANSFSEYLQLKR